ncbi:MAG TPA: BACON domain-containing carbohydrate-binding protein [Pyrinomonadaceae bacterium]|nr:BACON domain-containing carbohydrate-binding protein [Pyrinomonadaceae bacterium]
MEIAISTKSARPSRNHPSPGLSGRYPVLWSFIVLSVSLSLSSLAFPGFAYPFVPAEDRFESGNNFGESSPFVGNGIWVRKGDLGANASPSSEVFIFGTALWVISNGRVWHSPNEGSVWIDVSPPNLPGPVVEITSYGGVNDPLVLFVRSSSLFESKIYASSNGGGSWTIVPAPPVGSYKIFGMTVGGNKALVSSPLNWFEHPLYYTIDGGNTWTVLANNPAACQYVGELWVTSMTSTSSQYLFTTCEGSIYRLAGVGGSWTRTMNGISGNNIDTIAPARDGSGRIYATCYPQDHVLVPPPRCGYRSSDAGESWQPIGGNGFDSSPRLILSDAGDANRAYLFTNLSVFKTEDGGNSWRPFGMGLPNGATYFRGAAITNNGSQGNRPTIHRFDQSGVWSIYDSIGSGCSYTVSPTSPNNIGSGPGSHTVSVATQSGCYWYEDSYLLSDHYDWISHGGGTVFHRRGPGTVTFVVSYNPLFKQRTATFRLLGSDYIINQSPAERICSIPPTTISFGQTLQGNITNSDCFYDGYYFDLYSFNAVQGQKIRISMNSTSVNGLLILADNSEKIIVLSDPFDSTPLEAKIPEETGYFTIGQTGTYLVAAASFNGVFGTYSVTLMEDPATGCSFAISPESAQAGPTGGSSSFTVNTQPGCSWTASSNNPSWLTATSFGQGSGTVNYTITSNTGPAREATITVRNQTFIVNQSSGCSFSVEPFSLSTAAGGGTSSFQVMTSDMCNWQSGSSANWVVPIGSASGSGPGSLTLRIEPNPPGNVARQTVINIAGVQVGISQFASQLVTLTGRVTTASGRPISVARVTLADGSGNQRFVFSNPSGYFRFREVAEGATYSLSATHKRHSFDTLNIVAGYNGYFLSITSK